MIRSTLRATGSSVPTTKPSSHDLEERLQLPAGWIAQRTGVESRAIADSDVAVSDLAIEAGHSALARFDSASNPAPSLLLLATSTPDHLLPPTAPLVASKLNLGPVAALDIAVACCGFLYGLILADAIIRTQRSSVMVIGANILSRRCDPCDIDTRSIFADAAGAVILSPTEADEGILASSWSSDGSKWSSLMIPDGGSRSPFSPSTFDAGAHYMKIEAGRSVFRTAVESMVAQAEVVLQQTNYRIDAIDWWIPHQANIRIIESARRILKIPTEKTLLTIDRYGNSSAATIPVTLCEYYRNGRAPCIRSGDTILMTAAAAGATSSAIILKVP